MLLECLKFYYINILKYIFLILNKLQVLHTLQHWPQHFITLTLFSDPSNIPRFKTKWRAGICSNSERPNKDFALGLLKGSLLFSKVSGSWRIFQGD